MAKDYEKVEKKKKAAPKPVAPAIYTDGSISMQSEMITTEANFLELWEGTKAARGVDLKKAYNRAKTWREKHK